MNNKKNVKEEEGIFIPESKIKEVIKKKLPEWFEAELSSDYSNPLKEIVEEEIRGKDGILRKMVKEILGNVVTDEEFKKELGQAILAKIISKGLSRDD